MEYLISIDIGLKGAISVFQDGTLDHVQNMPTKTIIVKQEVRQFTNKNKSVLIKSGKNKGKRPSKIKTPAKTKTVMLWNKVDELFREYPEGTIYVDEPQFAMGYGKTIYQNQGIFHGLAIANGFKIIQIPPKKWQKHFDIKKKDKGLSIKIAHKIFEGWKFETHDQAESALIGLCCLNNLRQ